MRVLVIVGAAYLVTVIAERLFDLGVVTALLIGLAALALECGRLRPLSQRRQAAALQLAMPLLGLTHADPQWWRTTIVLYSVYLLVVAATLLRRKSTARRNAPRE